MHSGEVPPDFVRDIVAAVALDCSRASHANELVELDGVRPSVRSEPGQQVFARLLHCDDMVPAGVDDIRQLARARSRVPRHEHEATDRLCIRHASSRWSLILCKSLMLWSRWGGRRSFIL